jgi:four helix bundle protein
MLRGHRDLKVYQLAYKLAMEIFHLSKAFPREEIYSLTNQIRRSSRSVAVNLAEGFRKRRYPNMLVNKLTDCDGEAAETRFGSISRLTAVICQRITTTDLPEIMRRSAGCSPG